MTRLLVPVLVVVAIVVAAYLAVAIARMLKRSAWPGDSAPYRNHQHMARWIERQLRDDMVNVTIAPADRDEAKQLLREFYDTPQLGGGE